MAARRVFAFRRAGDAKIHGPLTGLRGQKPFSRQATLQQFPHCRRAAGHAALKAPVVQRLQFLVRQHDLEALAPREIAHCPYSDPPRTMRITFINQLSSTKTHFTHLANFAPKRQSGHNEVVTHCAKYSIGIKAPLQRTMASIERTIPAFYFDNLTLGR